MRAVEPILTTHLFAPLNGALLELLRSLTADEWNAPTVAGAWTVKDVAAHLLDTELRRLSMHRDAYQPPLPDDAFANGLSAFVNNMNAEGVAMLRRLSPELLIDLHERYGAQLAEFFESLHPYAPAKWGVTWAGEEESPMWFDVARELTERWHHQQQIRDAVGRPPLFEPYLRYVIDTFMRAMPFHYRDVEGGPIVVRIDEATWSLVDGHLFTGAAPDPAVRISVRGDKAWRILTRQKIDPEAVIEGERKLAEPFLKMITIL